MQVLPSPDGKYTIFTYTGDKSFTVLKSSEYKVVLCPDMEFITPSVFGGAIHTGAWHGNDNFLSVDMTGESTMFGLPCWFEH